MDNKCSACRGVRALILLFLVMLYEKSRHIGASVEFYNIELVILIYLLGISRLCIIPRFVEILRCEYARGTGRRFVVGHSLRATALVECVRRKAVCCRD